jgi:hypothetical protein
VRVSNASTERSRKLTVSIGIVSPPFVPTLVGLF